MEEETAVLNPMADQLEQARPVTGGLIAVEQQRAIAEVQARMIIARSNPRDSLKAVDLILEDCKRQSLAESAVYQYARGGTNISGPSIRLAEAIARRWGNVASGIKEVSRANGYSECVAYAWDLETGYYDERQYQVRHWRDTKKGGYPITDERDLYELTANMGQRRKRAVLLSVIPDDVVQAAVAQCEQTMRAKADTSPEAMKKMVEAFEAFHVTKDHIETKIQRRLDAIQPAQVVGLKKIYASLRDGMSAAADWFEIEPPIVQSKSATETLKTVAKSKTEKPKADKEIGMVDHDTGEIIMPPVVEIAKLRERLTSTTDIDMLDADADLIDAIDGEQNKKSLLELYHQRREQLLQKRTQP